ncbi:hypothetical protein Poly51_25460 [Rubripirellula tenax]|uniref:Uncharacterized protein n=1 Tax=Rubripirellula tenax TaxID=2528015 RepID=A0A5C6F7S7_9BACT|nr:hypothetical protein [Rubripirellula tenax]TWU56630.1 hypothetical protein Poly51_25460 [Rubripirellula tenax]
MTRHHRTGRDTAHYAIVVLPLLILCGMFAASMLQWRSERAKLDEAVEIIVGPGKTLNYSTMPRLYDERTSDESTATWKAVLAASEAHNAKYGGPFAWSNGDESYDDLVPPGQTWPVAEIMSRYASDAKPILEQIEPLMDSDETIWVPIVFEGTTTNLNEVQQMRSVARVLHYSFLDAVHQGENARAIRMLEMSDRLFGRNYQSSFLVDELVRIACYSIMLNDVRESTANGIWSDDERRQLTTIISKPIDWDDAWQQSMEAEMLCILPAIVANDLGGMARHTGIPTMPFQFSPSTLRAIVENQHSLALVRGAGTSRHVEDVERANNRLASDSASNNSSKNASIDRWMQLATLDSDWIMAMVAPAYQSFASAFRRTANEHRFTRTVVAIGDYQSKFDKWPESLSDLADVGLAQSETAAFDGGPFHYEIGDKEVTIYDQNLVDRMYAEVGRKAEKIVMVKQPNTEE